MRSSWSRRDCGPAQCVLVKARDLRKYLPVDYLSKYQKNALKLAQIVDLGPNEGLAAKIPGFSGLIAIGQTRKQVLQELESALNDWVALALKRGLGLPRLIQESELIPA